MITQEEDKAKRKAELTTEYEEKVAAKKANEEEEEGTIACYDSKYTCIDFAIVILFMKVNHNCQ